MPFHQSSLAAAAESKWLNQRGEEKINQMYKSRGIQRGVISHPRLPLAPIVPAQSAVPTSRIAHKRARPTQSKVKKTGNAVKKTIKTGREKLTLEAMAKKDHQDARHDHRIGPQSWTSEDASLYGSCASRYWTGRIRKSVKSWRKGIMRFEEEGEQDRVPAYKRAMTWEYKVIEVEDRENETLNAIIYIHPADIHIFGFIQTLEVFVPRSKEEQALGCLKRKREADDGAW